MTGERWRWSGEDAALLTGPSPTRPPVNRSLPLSTRGRFQRARSRPRGPIGDRARVLRAALRDHAADVALAQNPANTGAFKTKPRELPRGAFVNCAPPSVGGGGRMAP